MFSQYPSTIIKELKLSNFMHYKGIKLKGFALNLKEFKANLNFHVHARPEVSSLTFISGVHPLSQQEAAKLLLREFSVLDLHQVGCHAKRIVLEISFPLLPTT